MSEFLKEKFQKAKDFLFGRRLAYLQVFNPESIFTQRVLKDLAKFCRANDSTFHQDPRMHGLLEGRREVFLRIMHHTKLDPDQLWKYYGREEE